MGNGTGCIANHPEVNSAQARNCASERSILALKPRADVTRSLRQGYQWPKNFEKKDRTFLADEECNDALDNCAFLTILTSKFIKFCLADFSTPIHLREWWTILMPYR